MKRLLFIFIAILALAISAAAQTGIDPTGTTDPVPSLAQHTFQMEGLELAKGTFDQIDDKVWGNTFLVAGSEGKSLGQLTLSVDYVSGTPDAFNGNRVTNGTWSLALFREGQYAGSIYGNFVVGSFQWKISREGLTRGMLSAKLRVVGGTGSYAFVPPDDASLSTSTDYSAPKPVTIATFNVIY